ncbi:MAG: hypothetical protein C0614_05115 [Desulfuromonas sp.]|nr:MAG: hypothetical protein C0614_05115 [Desulfuromonas sp.]
MTQGETNVVRLKVSPQVAKIVSKTAPRDLQLKAARGAVSLEGKDLLTCLLFLCSSGDAEIKRAAVQTLRALPEQQLLVVLADEALQPQLINLLVRARLSSVVVMQAIIRHPVTSREVLIHLAEKADAAVLDSLAEQIEQSPDAEEIRAAMGRNPHAPAVLQQPQAPPAAGEESEGAEEAEDVDVNALMAEAEEEGASKFQLALNLRVADKIKIGLTGDKEWRSILIKDSNKLVQGAVIKNPRISDGEVLMIAKNKTSSDDLIRQILLNKDWMKLYEIKKALATHPKTPAPKAMRLISLLNTKDVKDLMRSKGVATVIVTTARKEFENRQKREGG